MAIPRDDVAPIALFDTLGVRIELDPDVRQAHCVLDLTDLHLNRIGVLHGGVTATLLDTASGITASLTVDPTGMAQFVTLSLTVDYLSPARGGCTVRATGRITGGGRSITYVACELRDESGALIATSTGVFKRVRDAKEPTE